MKIPKAGLFTICLLCISTVFPYADRERAGYQALAQADPAMIDPDYGIELQQNTECSFITGNSVNVRSGPGTQYAAIAQLNRGDGVRAQYREGNWVRLAARVYSTVPNERFEPLDGWVFNQYINGCSEDQFDRWRISNATTPTTPPVATPAAASSVLVALDSEGLRLVNAATGSTRPVPFGMGHDEVLAILTNLRDRPADQGINNECGAGPLSFASWADGLTLWFAGDRFAGWTVDGRRENAGRLTTISGIGPGSTHTELNQVYAAEVFQSSLGTEFTAGGLGGVLSGSGQDARVETLWSGTTCIFR
ncbi:MAG: SH3 domain-containing protein [Synechococcales bacterium]|nr:SH3 domain-containing protein [Synechococcales bacterium]